MPVDEKPPAMPGDIYLMRFLKYTGFSLEIPYRKW